ncbi:hypothetical protein PUN28_009708 [Cardiocondyla obscurior]|uniref:Uncharacterized protein n=1 Tax=Cardiocondyla obscurior TaxID=286306 RepID=A0AAW2FW27_9HYME
MLRNLTAKWSSLKRIRITTFYPSPNQRTYSERRRRSGDGRKRDIFEEKGAANEEEYFRKETARQLKELKEMQKDKEEKKNKTIKENDKIKKKNDKQEELESSNKTTLKNSDKE